MNQSLRYQINDASLVQDLIDGEVVIINLASGRYYSLQDCAAEVWAGLKAGLDLDRITTSLTARYACEREEARSTLDVFIADLEKESLIVSAGDDGGGASAGAPADTDQNPDARKPFNPPRLTVYADMEQLLLLDPIHEVDERGWPIVKGERT
jgi:hypothetical protein